MAPEAVRRVGIINKMSAIGIEGTIRVFYLINGNYIVIHFLSD